MSKQSGSMYANGLPPPLSDQEATALWVKYKEGDTGARALLIEHNLRLVVYVARKFENTGINIEDLTSIGSIGLIKAVNSFDPEKAKLATFATRCIENEILMHLRRISKIRNDTSFDEPLSVDWDGNELRLSDVLGTENNETSRIIEEQTDRKILREALDALPARSRLIMEMRLGLQDGEEKTQKDVAELLNISQSYISRLEKRAIKIMHKTVLKIGAIEKTKTNREMNEMKFSKWNPRWAGKALWLKQNTDLTQKMISEIFQVSQSAMWQLLKSIESGAIETQPDPSAKELYESLMQENADRFIDGRARRYKIKQDDKPETPPAESTQSEQQSSSEAPRIVPDPERTPDPSKIKTTFTAAPSTSGEQVPTGMAIELKESMELDIQNAIKYVTSMIKEGRIYNFEIRLTEA